METVKRLVDEADDIKVIICTSVLSMGVDMKGNPKLPCSCTCTVVDNPADEIWNEI